MMIAIIGLEHHIEMFDIKTPCVDNNKKQSNNSNTTSDFASTDNKNKEEFELPITIMPEGYIILEGIKPSSHKPTSSSSKASSTYTESVTSTNK